MLDWLTSLVDWVKENDVLMWWLFAASLALFLLTPIAVAWIVVQLPKDYFASKRRKRASLIKKYLAMRPVIAVVKNAFGVILVIAGLIMLVVPGQGLLTLVAGLMLLDFPGKFRLERWLATRPPVWRSINWLRKRAGREPLEKPKNSTA